MPLPRTLLLGIGLAMFLVGPVAGHAQAPESDYEGAAATGLALRRLGASARVLHIGAHPDDENTALFAPLALGRGIDVAYLSLTRGEGGQNGIGPELGTALGLIRSEELLAARRLDGGEQFFTRAVDYGYSKSADEAFRHWPRDTLLADVVAIIRRYRPDVVISVWSGTPADGHGQHHASGIIAREAVLAAGDSTRFPAQIEQGARPHTPAAFFWSGRFSRNGPDVAISTGELDPLLGRSYHQLAMASRSRHRSQDMGVPQTPGPRRTAFDRIDPADPAPVGERSGWGPVPEHEAFGDASLFAGVDTLLSGRAERVAGESGPGRAGLDRVVALLREYEARVAAARERFNPLLAGPLVAELTAAAASLVEATRIIEERTPIPGPEGDPMRDLLFHLDQEREDLHAALILAANLRLDAVVDRELVVPGESFRLELSVWNGGDEAVTARPRPVLPPGWTVELVGGTDGAGVAVQPGQRATAEYRVTPMADAGPTTPYYLDPAAPPGPETDLYHWPEDPELRGRPFAPDPVRAGFDLRIGDAAIHAERPAAWVGLDPRGGEYRRPVRVVPEVAVALAPALVILPASQDRRAFELTATVRAHGDAPVSGELGLVLPPGWTARPGHVRLELRPDAGDQAVAFQVTAPADVPAEEHRVGARFRIGERVYSLGYQLVDYPHIDPHHVYAPAETRVEVFDVQVADVRVGYIPGAGDGVPEALDQLGVRWEALGPEALDSNDLSRFDVIVTGIRAYEVRPDLATRNRKLLEWARNGGTLVIQYNKYEYPAGGFAPWPVSMARPHGRVTDPAAPVTLLEPDHPALAGPNSIDASDFTGWVQERGLYFLDDWDGPFQPLLAMADPGEEPLTGSLLVAPLGKGFYVYTGLAFFRQLPAGVHGAYRLFANLISLGASR